MNERLRILELIESGQLGVEEGVQRLEALSEDGEGGEAARADEAPPPAVEGARSAAGSGAWPFTAIVWQVVFGVGVAIVVAGGLLLARAYGAEGTPGLTWGWVVFVLGVLGLLLGWWLRHARWLTIRVREHDGTAFTLALPVPLALSVWFVRAAKPFVPQLQGMDADVLMGAMRDELRNGGAFVIQVDEGEAGDSVEVTIA